jgi:photosystem II stability/assembly factor-like uncharacterized protein
MNRPGLLPVMLPLMTLALLLSMLLAGCGMTSAWGSIGPSGGEVIISLAGDPHDGSLLYAGGSAGHIYRVSTGDTSTLSAGQGVPANDATNALLPDPTAAGRVQAATTDGLLLSTDSGRHWSRFGTGLPPKDSVESATYAGSDRTLFAGTEANGVYVSQDGGATWQASASGLPTGADIYTLSWDAGSQTLYAGLVGAGVYVSRDQARSWQASAQGMAAQTDVFQFAELASGGPRSVATVFAGTSKGLFASADGGHTWVATGSGIGAGRVLSLSTQPDAPRVLFAGTDDNVYRSTDGGSHFSVYAPGLSGHVAALVVVASSGTAPVVFAAAGPVQRVPSAVSGPSLAELFIAALMLIVLFFFLRRRQGRYDQLLRRFERRERRDSTTDPA